MNVEYKIGVISDTHKLLRQEVINYLQDVQLILHLGDIGSKTILDKLSEIAPVIAIKGNIDKEEWASVLPSDKKISVNGHMIYMIHNIKELSINPASEDIDIVISGHSHIPNKSIIEGVTYLNPGSIGPRRFKLPISMALINFTKNDFYIELVTLNDKESWIK